MQRIRMLSLKYSSLIDVLKFTYYNIHMEERTVINLLAIETVMPKRRIIRSAGAVYLSLIVLMIGCISVGNLVYENWQVPRYITQPILYGVIAICGVFLYRRHFIGYRYTLTDEEFAIEQVGSNREQTVAVLMIRDITKIVSQTEAKNITGKRVDASLPPSKSATWICTASNGVETAYRVSISESFLNTLSQQMQQPLVQEK